MANDRDLGATALAVASQPGLLGGGAGTAEVLFGDALGAIDGEEGVDVAVGGDGDSVATAIGSGGFVVGAKPVVARVNGIKASQDGVLVDGRDLIGSDINGLATEGDAGRAVGNELGFGDAGVEGDNV